jgi:hypothetical protein
MKYMTPELIARFRSADDVVAELAVEEWEQQGEAYRARLAAIGPTLPRGVRRLLRYNLHDARVTAIATDDTPSLSLYLELASPAASHDKQLELRYRLIGPAKDGLELLRHEALASDGKPLAWWMYDEIDVTKGASAAGTHSILFTGGYEMRFIFYQVTCRRLNFLMPPTNGYEMNLNEFERLLRMTA